MQRGARRAAAIALALVGAGFSLLLSADRPAVGSVAVVGHALAFVLALGLVLPGRRGRAARVAWAAGAVSLGAGAAIWLPGLPTFWRHLLAPAHAAAGVLAALAAVRLVAGAERTHRLVGTGAAIALLAPALLALLTGRGRAAAVPARYDAGYCYRFLTATTAEQAAAPFFPSALEVSGPPAPSAACTRCHPRAQAEDAHARAGEQPAYRATLDDFARRRGAEAARWCRGCHEPEALVGELEAKGPLPAGTSFGCMACHGAARVPAPIGSASIRVVRPGSTAEIALEARLRPVNHSRRFGSGRWLRSAELCGACHRKNWSLPQNGFRWQPGPDVYREWQSGPFSGDSLFAVGDVPRLPRAGSGCLGCHRAHGGPITDLPPPIQLDVFLRRPPPSSVAPDVLDRARPPRPGEPVLLDVVIRNAGIGHDFPTGMPDLYESWLEVTLFDREGRPALRSDASDPGAHRYRLVALDRDGRILRHGDLDRMASVREWRRIPPGEADLARYRLTAPPGGIGTVRARLLRRMRPEFARWAGTTPPPVREVASVELAAAEASARGSERGEPLAARWRRYGLALAGVRAYAEALGALQRALGLAPADPETALALGRVHFEEGDLLAALERFRSVSGRGEVSLRARAWEAATLRRMGQPARTIALARPLARRFPRDRRLRFELGLAYLAELRNAEAAREFEAMLAIDPLDVAAHYNRMLCLQRLNRLPEARREEALYRLLTGDEAAPSPTTAADGTAEPPGRPGFASGSRGFRQRAASLTPAGSASRQEPAPAAGNRGPGPG